MPAYRIRNHANAERELAMSGPATRPAILDGGAQALARRCGARVAAPAEEDLPRLIAYGNAFHRRHRERLDESLSTLRTATERAIRILSASLEPPPDRD